ncbi:MAG: hypothetical protein ACR2L3_01865, partial [Actinomycetota bacterium]
MPIFEVELQMDAVRKQIVRAKSVAAAALDAEQNFAWGHKGQLHKGEVLSVRRLGIQDDELSQVDQVLYAVDDEGWYDAGLDFLPWSFYREQLPTGSEEQAVDVMIKAWAGEGISMKLSCDPDDVASVHVVQTDGICWVLTTNDN